MQPKAIPIESNKKNKKSRILKKEQIITVLEQSPMGLTITEISERTGYHRNTISKYMNILEAEESVKKKEISRAHVYYTKRRPFLPRLLVNSFVKSLFNGMKELFPKKEEHFKKLGKKVLEHFEFPIKKEVLKAFEKVSKNYDLQDQLKQFQESYITFDLFQEELDISVIDEQDNKIIYRLKKSDFLDSSGDYNYFFYFVCGITEVLYLRFFNTKVNCNVKEIYKSSNEEESYVDISLELQ